MNGTTPTSYPLLLTSANWRQATQPDTAGYSIRYFDFVDPSNFTLRYYASTNIPDSSGLYTYYDLRVGLSAGAAIPTASLYDTALYGTATGWYAVDNMTPSTNTVGATSTSSYGWGYQYTNLRLEYDVAGQPMAQVVALTQSTTGTSISTMDGVAASSLTGGMPVGSRLQTITSVGTATPVGYRVSDGTVGLGSTTLAAMVSAYPVPTTPTGSNTVSMGNLHGSDACGATFCPQERTRAAFAVGNTIAVYLCDLNTSTNSSTNCTPQGAGTYSLGTAADGVTPIMTFPTLPNVSTIQTFKRVFVQRNGAIYYGFQDKLSTVTQTRLNYVGFRAVAAQLGISAP